MSDEDIIESAIDYFLVVHAEDPEYCRGMGRAGIAWFLKNSHSTKTLIGKFRLIETETDGNVVITPMEKRLIAQQREWVACDVWLGLVIRGTSPVFYKVEKDSAAWIE
jgi:hypothetical protein